MSNIDLDSDSLIPSTELDKLAIREWVRTHFLNMTIIRETMDYLDWQSCCRDIGINSSYLQAFTRIWGEEKSRIREERAVINLTRTENVTRELAYNSNSPNNSPNTFNRWVEEYDKEIERYYRNNCIEKGCQFYGVDRCILDKIETDPAIDTNILQKNLKTCKCKSFKLYNKFPDPIQDLEI